MAFCDWSGNPSSTDNTHWFFCAVPRSEAARRKGAGEPLDPWIPVATLWCSYQSLWKYIRLFYWSHAIPWFNPTPHPPPGHPYFTYARVRFQVGKSQFKIECEKLYKIYRIHNELYRDHIPAYKIIYLCSWRDDGSNCTGGNILKRMAMFIRGGHIGTDCKIFCALLLRFATRHGTKELGYR